MKWRRLGFLVSKSFFVYLMIYLILIRFNDRGMKDLTDLVSYQLLYPFPILPREQINFLRIIMVLGLNVTGFSSLFLLMGELSEGGRELIRFHSRDKCHYIVNLSRVLLPYYVFEFTIQLVCLLLVMPFIPHLHVDGMILIWLLVSWFLVDNACFLVCQLLASSSAVMIISLTFICLVRYVLISHILWFLPCLVLVGLVSCFGKENANVRN